MFKDSRSFPRGLVLLAVIIFIIPTGWLAPAELMLLLPFRPIAALFSSGSTESDDRITQLENEIKILHNLNRELTKKLQEITDFAQTQAGALNIKESYQIIIADVIIGSDASSWRRSVLLNQGTNSGIEAGLPVISGKCLVGKISEVDGFSSRVQLITDPGFRGKVMVTPAFDKEENNTDEAKESGKAKALSQVGLGVLAGDSSNQCLVKWVSRELPIKSGWQVLSAINPATKGTTCPKNLIIGDVTEVKEDSYFFRLTIKPAVDLDSLESVMVIKAKK